jgi:phage tail-like protein
MRGTVPGLLSPHPLGLGLPAVYQDEDAFTIRMTSAFDELLAPVIATLDNLSAYFDPSLAPEDFVDWLAEWVGMELDENWSVDLRRDVVAGATDLLARRGTAAGLADQLRLVTGGAVELVETGGTAWSVDAGSELPGSARPSLQVRVRVGDPAALDPARLDRLVTASKPAHVPHSIEILPLKGTPRSSSAAAAAAADAGPGEPPGAGGEPPAGGAPPPATRRRPPKGPAS